MNEIPISDIRSLAEAADAKQLAALERSLQGDTRKGVASILRRAHARLDACRAEAERLEGIYAFQASLAHEAGARCVVGLDEVGRGPLAGPLAVGAVVLPSEPMVSGLNDSKQVKECDRGAVAEEVRRVALAWSVQYVQPAQIDEMGIMKSLRHAFTEAVRAIEDQGCAVDMILLDGNPMHLDPREKNVVKGDSKCASIAAASILAKVARDELMDELDSAYSGYDFASNKGYGTQAHRDAIRSLGLCDIHRRSYCGEFLQGSLF